MPIQPIHLAVAIALAVTPAASAAQAAVGLKAGANFTSLAGAQDSGTLTGLAAGAYLGLGIADRLALQIEALYSTRGGRGIGLGAAALDPAAPASDVKLTYLEVPLLLRTGFPGERLLPSLFIGPYAGFLLSCQVTLEDGTVGECEDESRAAWFHPRATELGLTVGGGLDIAVGESTLFIDIRYAVGLLPIQSGEDGMDLRNIGLTATGGFAVPLGR